ncbi:MAG: PaaI family thioesterase [Burkholderiaceae bacterium]
MDANLDISRLQELFKPIFPGLIGLELLEVDGKTVRGRLKVRQQLCTGRDTLHWGVMVGMAQTLGTVAAVLNLPEGGATRTVNTLTDFHADPPRGTMVYATCRYEREYEGDIICRTEIHDDEGQLYAKVTQRQVAVTD